MALQSLNVTDRIRPFNQIWGNETKLPNLILLFWEGAEIENNRITGIWIRQWDVQIIKEDLLSADLSFNSTILALLERDGVREVAGEERTILPDPGFSS